MQSNFFTTRMEYIMLEKINKQTNLVTILKRLAFLTAGTFLSAIAFSRILLPNQLVAVGFGGIATILNHLFQWNIQLLLMIICVPVIVWSYFRYDRRQVFFAAYCFFLFTFLIGIIEKWIPPFVTDPIIAAIAAGVLMGTATGMILRQGVANGPEAIIGLYLHEKKGISIGNFFMILNIGVISLSLIYGNITLAVYSYISNYISSKVTDFVILGTSSNYSVNIISEHYLEITEFIHKELNRGVTFVQALGTYEVRKKMLLMTVVSERELVLLRNYIKTLDDHTFFYAMKSTEVTGGGFKMQ